VFKIPIYLKAKYEIKVKHSPSIPDNVKYRQVFEYDMQILRFMQMKEEYEKVQIDEEFFYENRNVFLALDGYVNQIAGRDIIQLKINTIPKFFVPLEKLFDDNDVAKIPMVIPNEVEVDDFNIGIEKEPRFIKLSKSLSFEDREKYLELMRQYSDVFSWKYEDLKVYDKGIIQHTIPIKEDHKPFKENLRRINPLLLPLIEKEVSK